ncbi:MAG: glycosyltransferase family 2 protein [Microbispora sp.]|nr:glycosyltransferase family 2 protein [Microbispora sp.]
MEILFWTAAAVLFWCYAGYPLTALGFAVWRPRPWRSAPPIGEPLVSVVLAVRNAGGLLSRRLENLLGQEYPAERLEVIVVCNGCTDDTEAVAARFARSDPRVRVLTSQADAGKAGALNAGVAAARGEFVVFSDVRQVFAPQSIRRLLEPFADPSVGAVTGRLVIGRTDTPAVEGVRWYWAYETALRMAESRSGSVIGATGAIYAIRRELFEELPARLILDDVYVPLSIVLRGFRTVFSAAAVAFDGPSRDPRQEYLRKRRTMIGNLQLIRVRPTLLLPGRNPVWLRYVSHKLLRLVTPLCCLGLVIAAGCLPELRYRAVFFAGVAGYALGILGFAWRTRVVAPFTAVVLMHAAMVAAFLRARQDASAAWPDRGTARTRPRPRAGAPVRDAVGP